MNVHEIHSNNKMILNKEYNLHISKEPAQLYKYLIGYIDYNINLYELPNEKSNGTCKDLPYASSMVYAKYTGLPFNQTNTFMKNSKGKLYFYHYLYDLLAVDKFWRIGIFGCPMTGDLGPKINKKIRLDCDNI